MSAESRTPTADAPADDEPAIVTEFRERLLARHSDCESVSAALRREEQRPSTTPAAEQATCPSCYSHRVTSKVTDRGKPGSRKCTTCGTHLQHPADGHDLRGDTTPTDPRAWVGVVAWAGTYHHAEGCVVLGRTLERLTAAAIEARGLAPCPECAPVADDCAMCGRPTFGAIAGAGQPICAACVEVSE